MSEDNFHHIKRMKRGVDKNGVSGIGVGILYHKAKLAGKKFIDDYTYVEKEGDPDLQP